MGLLDSFEKGLERAVNGAFAKTFRSGIQPVEIASALKREIDTASAVVSRDRILAPNDLQVTLNPGDEQRMHALGSALTEELRSQLQSHATAQGYTFAGPLKIAITGDPGVAAGTVQVSSASVQSGAVSWQATAQVDGRSYPIGTARTIIGRGSDADIPINDPGSSRRHAEILWDGERAMVRDLGSTNGTSLNGQRIDQAALPSGSTITIGRTDIVFRVIAARTPRGARR